MLHAARQLDRVEEVLVCWFLPLRAWGAPDEILKGIRDSHLGNASTETLFRAYSEKALVHRDGRLTEIDSLSNGVDIAHPLGGSIRAYPVTSNEVVTIPRQIPEVGNVSALMSLAPPQVNALWQSHGRRIVAGADPVEEMVSFYEKVRADPDRWLVEAEGAPKDWLI